jgi:hypothetical protein
MAGYSKHSIEVFNKYKKTRENRLRVDCYIPKAYRGKLFTHIDYRSSLENIKVNSMLLVSGEHGALNEKQKTVLQGIIEQAEIQLMMHGF